MSGEHYILEAHTTNCMKVKNLFCTIKDLLFDCNIHVNEEGMKICNLDSSKAALVNLKLPASHFAYFYCEHPMTLGVSITCLHKYLGHISQNDVHMLKLLMLEGAEHELILEIINNEDEDVHRFYMKLLDLSVDPGGLDPQRFSCVISIPSEKFQRYCRSHALVGDVMEIVTIGDRVEFRTVSTESDGDRAKTVLHASTDQADDPDCEDEDDEDDNKKVSIYINDKEEMIAARFSLEFLQMFAKAKNLAPNVVVYFKRDFPLVLHYKMRDLGELKFALAAKVQTDF